MSFARRATALPWLLAAACALPGDGRRDAGGALDELLARPELTGGRIGVLVVDAATGEVLAEHAADLGFATASNMKLLSAAVALASLGPDATTSTELRISGAVTSGTLHGDVAIVGRGDPTFGEERWPARPLDAFVLALRERGIERVTGRVLGDGSWQGAEVRGLGWQWDYLDEDYAAPFGGLCCAGNVTRIEVTPDSSGTPRVAVTRNAPLAGAPVVQVAAGEPTRLQAGRELGRSECSVRGQIAADAKPQVLRVAVHDPALAAASLLLAAMNDAGISVAGGAAVGAAAQDSQVLSTHTSPPLAAIVQPLLSNSDNLYAEQVWRWSARVGAGDGSTAAAERHGKQVLAGLGVDTGGMVLADGSGLSRRNLVRPRQIVALLQAMHRSPLREAFVSGLPIAGQTGTLRSRFAAGAAHGHVRAKTGYISRVVCLSGYVQRAVEGAAPLAFAVMLNDFTCGDDDAKAAVDAFVQQLAVVAGW